ncbi:glycerol-3-phosphate dehydrogenase C-terminal domain-containing protein, partial [Allgaiera indica]
GASLTEAEVRWLIDHEFARAADDILWRRTKLGLRLDAEQAAALQDFIQGPRGERRESAHAG